MSAMITFDFAGGQATSTELLVTLQNGAFALASDTAFNFLQASITNIAVLPNMISFATAVGAQMTGTLALVIGWSDGQTPSVTLENIANASATPASVIWPTATGLRRGILASGDPLALAEIVAQPAG